MEDAGPQPSSAPRRRTLATFGPLVVVLLGVAYLLRGMFEPGYTEGSDTLAHLFRIQQISRWIHHPGGLFDWTDQWYGGFHQFSLYPYLTYIPAGVLDAVTGAPLASMKVVMLASVLAGTAAVYFVSLELSRDQPSLLGRAIGAAAAAAIFAVTPAFLGFMFGFGEYSDFIAIALAPAALLVFLRACRYDDGPWWAAYGVALALLLLMHPHVGVCAAIGHATILLFSPDVSARKYIGMAYAAGLAFVLSLYFWVPFLLLRESAGDPSLGTPFSNPIWAIEFADYFDREGLRYVGAVVVGLAVAGTVFRPTRGHAIPIAASVFVGLVIALGGTIPFAANIPIVDMINPERALVIVIPGLALLAGFAVTGAYRAVQSVLRPWQAAAVATGLIALVVVDTYFFNERTARTVAFSQEFMAVTDYLEAQTASPFDRVLFVQPDYNLSAYSPALSQRSVTEGSQVQGAQTPPDVARLGVIPEDAASLSQVVALASRFNVRWFVIDRSSEAATAYAGHLASAGLATERFSQGRYVVLESLWRPKLVRRAGPPVLEIGPADVSTLVAALSGARDIEIERGASERLDDYSLDSLARFGIVILADPQVDDTAATDAVVAAYEDGGGIVYHAGDVLLPAQPDELLFTDKERRIKSSVATGSDAAIVSTGYSPYWSIEVDGIATESRSSRGLQAIQISEGPHEIVVTYNTPVLHHIAQIASILAWFGTLGWLAWCLLRWWRMTRADNGGAS